ncbi:MAG: phospholipid/cholesterol/gamma-HCH transport system permease protein [Solirubrobacterales bacterium]|nr:phospholipid/cholesterol/gamma-HCH transport system permease protein [Solirubrobacterales bacterium]
MSGEVNTRADIERLEAEEAGSAPRGPLETIGGIAALAWQALREFRHWPAFLSEGLRQASLIATGSVLVILAISFLAGGSCGLESTSLARAFGTRPIGAGFSSWCTLREVVPFVFGYILAAKVGCGIVAELGAMRVNEEVDALEAMGVRPLAHLVCSRLLGAAIVLPFAYLLAIGSSYLAAYLISAKRFGDVSQGTWSLFFYLFQDPVDLVYSLVKGMVISVFVITTAVFFGYTVRGGPAEVGVATARSMAVNIVAVTVISMAGTLVFWGANPRIPFG